MSGFKPRFCAVNIGGLAELNIMNTATIKRLIRRRGSGQYLADDGWTDSLAKAKNFRDVMEATRTCAECELQDVELVLVHEGSTSEFFSTPVR
jgi:hypothetical protein